MKEVKSVSCSYYHKSKVYLLGEDNKTGTSVW